MSQLLERGLARRGFVPTGTNSAAEALALVQKERFDIVVADLNMPGTNGLELCARIVENRADTPVVVITAFGSMDTAIAAIRAGAYDFITKPFELDALVLALDRALTHYSMREEVKLLRRAVGAAERFDELIGSSPEMQKVHALLEDVAQSEATVLLTGETGTGKEIAAKGLHRRGPRRDGPFIAVNCAALPEALLESELFGHVKGAFTDAKESRDGLFVRANHGTLFLDEIGDMPPSLQPKLLRVLQDRTVRPLGGTEEVPVDVRIIAATHRDLESAIEEKTFREDLYFRINVIHVALPPLRSRGGDVLLLAQSFLESLAGRSRKEIAGISATAAEKLLAYPWPGNIRELQNGIERAVAVARASELLPEDLPEKIRDYKRSHVLVVGDDPKELVTMDELERRYTLRVLELAGGNKTMAAQILGFDRKTLYRKLEKYGVK
ncbi:MAG: sigma-54-dependent Fis family transcriptional regulator [Myxococcaceae bacterium]|nr:sigma-54-dependent Fis family transcriptional regulator [Myxococcaceae bacterium]